MTRRHVDRDASQATTKLPRAAELHALARRLAHTAHTGRNLSPCAPLDRQDSRTSTDGCGNQPVIGGWLPQPCGRPLRLPARYAGNVGYCAGRRVALREGARDGGGARGPGSEVRARGLRDERARERGAGPRDERHGSEESEESEVSEQDEEARSGETRVTCRNLMRSWSLNVGARFASLRADVRGRGA